MNHGFQRKQFFIKWASQFIIAQLVRLVIMVILIEKDFFCFFNVDREQPNETELPLIFKHVLSSSCKSIVMYNWAEPFNWKIVR